MPRACFLLVSLLLTLFWSAPRCLAVETVIFWYGATREEKLSIDDMIAEFNSNHPDIRVVGMLTPMQQIQQKLLLSVAGGVPPDVVRFYTDLGGELMAREGLERIDLLAKRDNVDLKAFYPVSIEQNTFQGRLYGMPWVVGPKALFYNKRLFREAGLDPDKPPRTWQEMEYCAKRLTKRNAAGRITQLGYGDILDFATCLWQSGGTHLTPDGRHPAFNSPEGVKALSFWLGFLKNTAGDIDELRAFQSQFSGATTDPFGLEKLAMRTDSPFRIPDMKRYFPNLDYGIAPFPSAGPRLTEVVGNSLVIPRGARHKEAAWEFIKFATSYEQVQRVCARTFRLPARIDASMDPAFTEHPHLKGFVSELPYGRSIPVVPGYMEMAEALGRGIEQALKGNMTPQQALDKAAADSERILSRSMEDVSPLPVINWRLVIGTLGVVISFIVVGAILWVRKQTARSKRDRREALEFYAFLAPWICGFLLLTFGAVAASMVLSFSRWDVLTEGRWVGWRNYTDLIRSDPRFIHSLVNTLVYSAMAIPVSMCLGLATAMLLNLPLAGIRFFRTLFYVPVVVSGVATSLLWQALLNPTTGYINRILSVAIRPDFAGGFHWAPLVANPPGWLADPMWSKPALVLMGTWGVGGAMLIYLAGLQGIPKSLYEAAELDGATGWKRFRNVTIPLLTPVLFYQLVMGIIGSFQVFTQAYVMTGGSGAPEDSLLFYVLYLFNNAFQWLKIGYASAMAWILFVIVLIVTLFNLAMAKRWVYYEGERSR